MLNFLIYIGKSSVATGFFYLAFIVLFQKQKHFNFNRVYLLLSFLMSLIIPLITIPIVKQVDIPVTDSTISTMVYLGGASHIDVLPDSSFSLFHYLFGAYVLGMVAFVLHLVISHLKAIRIINNSRLVRILNHSVHITSKDVHPFSFFNTIVLSEKTLLSPDLEMIVSHEKVHVQEKHTIDIFLVELMFLLQWFNPFAWLLKAAVRNNLEYKTDDTITKFYHPQKYQFAMVALADKKEVSPFLTALNGSQLKNRIIMMKKKTKSKFTFAKQIMVVPLFVLLILGLSEKEVISKPLAAENNNKHLVGNVNVNVNNWSISGGVQGEVTLNDNKEGMKLFIIPDEDMHISFSKDEAAASFPIIFVDGVRCAISSNSNFDFKNATIEDFAKLIDTEPTNIESIEVIKDTKAVDYLDNVSDDDTVLLIKTKQAINSLLKLRQAIFNRIKFPAAATDDVNDVNNVSFYVRVKNGGKLYDITEEPVGGGEIVNIGEFSITTLRDKNKMPESDMEHSNLIAKEAERVLKDLPEIKIPEYYGKMLIFDFKFILE